MTTKDDATICASALDGLTKGMSNEEIEKVFLRILYQPVADAWLQYTKEFGKYNDLVMLYERMLKNNESSTPSSD